MTEQTTEAGALGSTEGLGLEPERAAFERWYATTDARWWNTSDAAFAAWRAAVAAERERCAVAAWSHYMDICKKRGLPAAMFDDWCAAGAIRGPNVGVKPQTPAAPT
jgi:hypothetical protein